MMLRVAAGLVLLSLAGVSAAETEWQEIAPEVRARLVSSDVLSAQGTTLVGLELSMPPTTNTYWRVPGETGIPIELDLTGSTGISDHRVHWPYPTVETAKGYLDYVYYGPLVLPIEVSVAGPNARLTANVTLGVCSDICVPASFSMELPLDFAAADAGQRLRLRQAMAVAPADPPDTSPMLGDAELAASGHAIAVEIGDATVDVDSLIADFGGDGPLIGPPQKSPQSGIVELPLLGGENPAALVGRPVTFTFMTQQGAFETTRRLGPAAVTPLAVRQ